MTRVRGGRSTDTGCDPCSCGRRPHALQSVRRGMPCGPFLAAADHLAAGLVCVSTHAPGNVDLGGTVRHCHGWMRVLLQSRRRGRLWRVRWTVPGKQGDHNPVYKYVERRLLKSKVRYLYNKLFTITYHEQQTANHTRVLCAPTPRPVHVVPSRYVQCVRARARCRVWDQGGTR